MFTDRESLFLLICSRYYLWIGLWWPVFGEVFNKYNKQYLVDICNNWPILTLSPIIDLPCVPQAWRYMVRACAWPVARWARGTFLSSAALYWTPHLVPLNFAAQVGGPSMLTQYEEGGSGCLQQRHWYPAFFRRDSSTSGWSRWLWWIIHVTVVTVRGCLDSSRSDSFKSESGPGSESDTYPGRLAYECTSSTWV